MAIMDAQDMPGDLTDNKVSSLSHVVLPDGSKMPTAGTISPLPAEARGLARPTRKREISTEEDKLEARRVANRKSALQSRMRRKQLISTYTHIGVILSPVFHAMTHDSRKPSIPIFSQLTCNNQLPI